MAEKELTTQLNNEKQKSEGLIEIYASDIWRGFLKLWWICILITIICSLAMIAFSFISFKPVYKVSATFTVQTQDISASGTGITSIPTIIIVQLLNNYQTHFHIFWKVIFCNPQFVKI